jgi:hypothetical protein
MARCASEGCGRWIPDLMVRRGTGFHVDDSWLCSVACVERTAERRLQEAIPVSAGIPRLAPVRLGTLLRHQDAVTAKQLERALIEQRRTGLKLGAQVTALGFADAGDVLRALAVQAGTSYLANVDPLCVHATELRLGPGTVRALGLVPFGPIVNGRTKVACTTPVPRSAVSALAQLTGLTLDLYLVTDDDWGILAEAYDGAVAKPDPLQPALEVEYASSLPDVAVRVAAAATSARRTVVTQAQWDPYTWVRVQSRAVIHDVLFAHGYQPKPSKENISCPVASTSH